MIDIFPFYVHAKFPNKCTPNAINYVKYTPLNKMTYKFLFTLSRKSIYTELPIPRTLRHFPYIIKFMPTKYVRRIRRSKAKLKRN